MARKKAQQPAVHRKVPQAPPHSPAGIQERKRNVRRRDGMASRRSEERLADDQQEFHIPVRKPSDQLVPLRDGTEADIGQIEGAMAALRLLKKGEPQAFQALLALVNGQPGQADKAEVDVLKRWDLFLAHDGSVEPFVSKLLLLAGPDLADPYRADSTKDQWRAAIATEDHQESLEKARPLLDALRGRGKRPKESDKKR
jgi:hypothetical protein